MWFSPQTDALVYRVPDPLRIAAACPTARQLDDGSVAVPASLDNLQALTKLKLPIVEPLRDYDWPIRSDYRPRDHQKVMANFMVANPRSFNLSDMGTMKTLAALWACDFVMLQQPKGKCRAIITVPISTFIRVWGDAIFQNMLGRRTYAVLHGTADQRKRALARDVDFYIINPEGLCVGVPKDRKLPFGGLAAELQQRTDIKIGLIDESRTFADHTIKRHRAARGIIQNKDYLWLMTGTPTPNGPLDAYGQARLVNGARGQSFRAYRDSVMMQISPFKWIPRQGSSEIVRDLMSPAIRYAIEDCVDLPACTVQAREAEMSPEQEKAYKDLKRELSIQIKSKEVTAANEGVLRMKLIQIACGAVYDGEHKAHDLNPANRVSVLEEVLDQSTHKTIIFAPLTSVINMLKTKLSKRSVAVVNGQVGRKERDEIFRAFQEDEHPRIIVADPGTMAHGLTLTKATTVVWYAPTDKTELYLQANARINRPGQVHQTTVVQISACSIEREIYRRLEANESLQGVVLKMVEE